MSLQVPKASSKLPLLALVCLGLILGFAWQGTRSLWRTDEGRYAGGALQMLDSGNYLMPAYSPDEPNFSKPPLTYWAIAASFRFFGRNTWAARTPYALAYLFTILLLYAMGRQCIPDKPWLPGLVYGCSAFPFLTANIITTDTLLTLWEALAMLGFLRVAFDPEGHHRQRFLLLMWVGWGLAFLTKGPPGLIPWLAIIPFVVIRDGWRGLGRLFSVAGVVAFLVIGLGWYAAVVLRYQGLLHYFLHTEVYDRIFTAELRRNPGPVGWAKVYLPVIILGSLPWWSGMKRGLSALFARERWKTWIARCGWELFLLLWFGVPFIIFCLAQSRLALYVLPLFLPLSLLLALALQRGVDLRKSRQWMALVVWIVLLLAAKAVVAYRVHPATKDEQVIARAISAAAAPAGYSAVVFVENTASAYIIEEQTPWGTRLYTGKPVYGIAWWSPHAPEALCQAARHQHATLLVADYGPDVVGIRSALSRCKITRVVSLGTWQHRALELATL